MAKSKEKIESTTKKVDDSKNVIISNKANVIPSVEQKPNQAVLDVPKPKEGISLMKSWKHANSKK